MGLNFKCNSIYEFDIENNGADEIFKENTQMLNFASAVYNKRYVIMTGGSHENINSGKNTVVEYSFGLSDGAGNIEC